MKLEKDGTRGWKAVTEYSDIVSRERVKKAGFRWDKVRKIWTSQSATVVQTLISSLDSENVQIENWLVESVELAAAQERARRDAAIAGSRATDASVNIPAPADLEYLPYQRAGVVFLRDCLANGGGALLADEMGLGKTIQVIGYMNMLLAETGRERMRVLIIAPKIALLNWRAELEKWLIKPHSIAIWSTSSQPYADIVIINYDIVAKLKSQLADPAKRWDLLACDESHALKDQKAQRTRAVLGSKSEMPIPAHRRIFVTGTPILNRPIELFSILKSCGVDFAINYFDYARRYCGGHSTRFGFDATGASNLDELQEYLRSSVMVRRLKSDVLTELPAKRRQVVTVDPSGSAELRKAVREEERVLKEHERTEAAARAAIDRAEKLNDKAAYDAAVKSLNAVHFSNLAVVAELRQRTALAKAPFVVDAVTEILGSVPDAVLVFAHHKEVVARLADGMRAAGHEPAIITGETSMEDRQQAQDDIQHGRKRVFIGSIQACGVAITLTAASTVVFAELDWTPGRLVQAEDRAHRIGQRNAVLVQYHVVDRSIDAHMLQQSWSKAFDAAQALDDAPEITAPAVAEDTPRIVMEVPPLDPIGLVDEPDDDPRKRAYTDNTVGQAHSRRNDRHPKS
ncbi:DEAD/DEAH box helicase [Peteryoungia algae]|uniref:DEAD/DEAH box helicase n=1 Tax=Peteryoungia algae TaxID=2919917 RepID=A0ABT0CXC8_9HYPH|nr:DEAD/DEAH box helicase [Rhizobium sp. SSM4.3]MCJ8237808.1 DEAD/DEAH box helicase [Rhizobium sp. SSM4.3]